MTRDRVTVRKTRNLCVSSKDGVLETCVTREKDLVRRGPENVGPKKSSEFKVDHDIKD